MATTKHGRQPAADILVAERWTVPLAAKRIGVEYAHLSNAIGGRTIPSQAVREGLPSLLGVPLSDLFTEDVLSRVFKDTTGKLRQPKAADRDQS